VIDSNILAHPVASKLPLKTDGPSVQTLEPNFRPFDGRLNFPKFEELTKHDIPPISVHVTSFNDATIVALSWPHHLMDAMGGKALLSAWSLVLAGQEEEVPEVVGAREDILKNPEITAENDEEFALGKSRMGGIGLLLFQVRFLWDCLWNGSREKKVIYIPKETFKKIEDQVKEDIAANVSGVETAPWVTENDILVSWMGRVFATTEQSSRPITILNFLNLRFRVPLLLRTPGILLQNICVGTYTFLSAAVARGPVGQIALENRRHTAQQGTDEQGRRFMMSIYKDIEEGRTPHLFYGPITGVVLLVNNVVKIELIKTVDFAPAVIRTGEDSKTRKNPLGSMVSYYNAYLDGMYDALNTLVMYGKDHADNYWIGGALLPRAWKAIDEALKKL
jgi:hypothetical protein